MGPGTPDTLPAYVGQIVHYFAGEGERCQAAIVTEVATATELGISTPELAPTEVREMWPAMPVVSLVVLGKSGGWWAWDVEYDPDRAGTTGTWHHAHPESV